MNAVDDYVVDPLSDLLLDYILEQYGEIGLGGPYLFQQDILGTTLEAQLLELSTDAEGLGIGVGLGLDEPVSGIDLEMPTPGPEDAPEAHLAVGLHEALLDTLLSETILDLLDLDLELSGIFGSLLDSAVTSIPGGEDAPESDGWCLALKSGEAHVARLKEGTSPLAVLYLPDVSLEIGSLADGHCEDWLEASVVIEADLNIEHGALISLAIDIPEGAIIDYETSATWVEDEVLDGLTGLLDSALSLLGSTLELDLNDLSGSTGNTTLDSLTDNLSFSITDSTRLLDDDGEWTEGLFSISLRLFDDR